MALYHCPATILVKRDGKTHPLQLDLVGILHKVLSRHVELSPALCWELCNDFASASEAIRAGSLVPTAAWRDCYCPACSSLRRIEESCASRGRDGK